MLRKFAFRLLVLCIVTGVAFAQGLSTTATKDDWEEVNFEFNSAILSDGYPSLLRLADLLKSNPSHRVKVEGHTDSVGSHRYNDKLAMNRANAVKTFLEKYGARPGQIQVAGQGKRDPKVDNKTKEGRFMNRRVTLTVTDGQGNVVSAGGVGDAITALEKLAQKQEECCNAILKRLDKLDEILKALEELKGENAGLRRDIDALKTAQAARSPVEEAAKPPSSDQLAKLAEKAAEATVARSTIPHFSLLGVNLGSDDVGNLTFSGKARYFAPFKQNFAVQAQGEYLGFHGRQEGQFDIGLVNRHNSFQMGLFSSLKSVAISEYQRSGMLGQAAVTLDHIFSRGKVGVFGAKGFKDSGVVNINILSRNLIEETYLHAVDQVGGSATVALAGRAWAEGNLGYLKSRSAADRPGGTLRFVFPFKDNWAFTLEGGFNETLLARSNSGRVVAGIQFGSFINPRRFAELAHPVPVDVPRVRYEAVTRRVRTGNDPPVADAGPDQIGVGAGTIRLDGSASFDPDGDPITFEWSQIAGPTVSITGMNAAVATFTAAEAQTYSFRLRVKDDKGAQALARVTVTTKDVPRVRIISFVATPVSLLSGQSSTLNWQVENADTVTISGVGNVNKETGTAPVSPSDTTVYTLTAVNRVSQATASVVVSVERPTARFLRCQVTPANIIAGEVATIAWESKNADQVTLSPGFGGVPVSGSQTVSPLANTTYTLTARNQFGEISCPLTVQVTPGSVPRIVTFTANPMEILAGESSTLNWVVEGADDVSISALGSVQNSGSSNVTPPETTTYVLTARNRFGEVSATATVTVVHPARIVSFTATPNPVGKANDPTTLAWTTENAVEVIIDNAVGSRPVNGSLLVRVPQEITYTLVALGRRGSRDTATVTVKITTQPPGDNTPPVANAGPALIDSLFRDLILDGSASFDPDPGDTLTYQWTSVGQRAAVLDPNSPRTRVQLGLQFGRYDFELTVTDSKGATSKAVTSVNFLKTTLR